MKVDDRPRRLAVVTDGMERDVVECSRQRPLDTPHLGGEEINALLRGDREVVSGGECHSRQRFEKLGQRAVGTVAPPALRELAVE